MANDTQLRAKTIEAAKAMTAERLRLGLARGESLEEMAAGVAEPFLQMIGEAKQALRAERQSWPTWGGS